MAGYDVAQICMNGHVANPASRAYPDPQRKFCAHCGAPLVQHCKACGAEIKGIYVDINSLYTENPARSYRPPGYCEKCGEPFPWTESKIGAAKDLIELAEKLNDTEKATLAADLPDLVRDTPRTQVAATRFKKLAAKVGGGIAAALRDVIVDIASEAAKKVILGP
jgi:hypothetical protein